MLLPATARSVPPHTPLPPFSDLPSQPGLTTSLRCPRTGQRRSHGREHSSVKKHKHVSSPPALFAAALQPGTRRPPPRQSRQPGPLPPRHRSRSQPLPPAAREESPAGSGPGPHSGRGPPGPAAPEFWRQAGSSASAAAPDTIRRLPTQGSRRIKTYWPASPLPRA